MPITGTRYLAKKTRMEEKVRKELEDWAINFLEVPNEKNGSLSVCPYAGNAFRKGKARVIEKKPSETLSEAVKQFDPKKDDVLIIFNTNYELSASSLHHEVDSWNEWNYETGLYLMAFHPDEEGEAVEMFGTYDFLNEAELDYTMVFVQKIEPLDDAAIFLEEKGYYDDWSFGQYKDLVLKRRAIREKLNNIKKERYL